MNPLYNRKLQSSLITTGKKVEAMQYDKAPTIRDLIKLFDQFVDTAENEDMKGQTKATEELIAALTKWQIEKL